MHHYRYQNPDHNSRACYFRFLPIFQKNAVLESKHFSLETRLYSSEESAACFWVNTVAKNSFQINEHKKLKKIFSHTNKSSNSNISRKKLIKTENGKQIISPELRKLEKRSPSLLKPRENHSNDGFGFFYFAEKFHF